MEGNLIIYKRVMIVNVLHFRQCCVVTFFKYGNHFGELLKNSTTQNVFGKNRGKNVTVLSKDDKQQYCETFSF